MQPAPINEQSHLEALMEGCPICHHAVMPVLYGMPSNQPNDQAVKVMGCDMSGDRYTWYCPKCDLYFA